LGSLQYVIDSICSKITVESMFKMIRLRLSSGPFETTDIIPLIRNEDRSLDNDSAKQIIEAAIAEMTTLGEVRTDNHYVYRVI
jgi:hypothetical protein